VCGGREISKNGAMAELPGAGLGRSLCWYRDGANGHEGNSGDQCWVTVVCILMAQWVRACI
jgi:hypothetical protein